MFVSSIKHLKTGRRKASTVRHNKMKYLIFTITLLNLSFGFSQENTYIFIQDRKEIRSNKLFHWTDSIKAEGEVKFDTTKSDKYEPYLVKVIHEGIYTDSYMYPDETGINFGKYIDSLKIVNIYTGISVEYKYALQIADSLKTSKIPFDTYPNLNTKEKYRLRFFAWHDIPNDDKALAYDERRNLAQENYDKFIFDFHKEFSEVDSTNIWIFSMMPGHLDVSIFLENTNFDFSRLNKFDIKFEYKPILRPRLFDFTIFEEQ